MGLRKVGAAWIKEGKKGKFMSADLQLEGRTGPKVSLLIFKNEKKDKPRDPDYIINVREDDDRKEASGEQRTAGDDSEHPF